MLWIKYRSKWASGPDYWEYQHFPDGTTDESIQVDFIEEEGCQHTWSDKYRGTEWEHTDIPDEILTGKISALENKILNLQKLAKDMQDFKRSRK